ncbi:hypothetical protein Tco_0228633 [Tanacetum coccineum]
MAKNEVNEIRTERQARNANPLAVIVATQQPVYNPQSKPTYYTQTSTTKSPAATRSKRKEIAKAPSLPGSDHEVVSDEKETRIDKDIQKLMALISTSFKIYKPTNNNIKTSSSTRNKNVDNTPRENIDEEKKDQELEAHYVYMVKIQEVIITADADNGPIFDKEPLEKDDSNITPDSLDMCNDEGKVDQDTAQEEERDLLALLIENMKIEIDESKKINKELKKANMSLNSELKRYKESNYVKEANIEFARAYGLVKEQKDKLDKYCSEASFQVFDIKQKFLELEKQLFAHKNTISTLQYENDEQKSFTKHVKKRKSKSHLFRK